MRGRETRLGGDEMDTFPALKGISRTFPFILSEMGSPEGFSTRLSHNLGQTLSVLKLDDVSQVSSREIN